VRFFIKNLYAPSALLCGCAAAVAILSSLTLASDVLAKKTTNENTSGASAKNYEAGVKMFERGDFDGCIDAELQAVYFSRNGYEPKAYYQLGLGYQSKKDYQKAYDALSKSCTQAMDNANEAHLALSQVCNSMKKYDEAMKEVIKAMNGIMYDSPLYKRCLMQQAIVLDDEGHPRDAITKYAECLGTKAWSDWEPWIRLAECNMKVKEWNDAYKCLDGMLTTNRTVKGLDFERVHLDMGICALAKGNHQGAMDNWHKTLEYNPDNKEAHLQLALLLDSEKHMKSAINEYKYFLRQAGSGDDPRINQVQTRIALMEQMLHKEEPVAPVEPSPYMRNQQKEMEKQQQQPVGEPGF
jgi:tetratricopeptide (TPR) repeat protein